MKRLAIISFVLITLFGAISVSAQCDPNSMSQIRCSYYNEGHQDGVYDAQNRFSNDYKRHRDKYERKYENDYRDGYQRGYLSIGGDGSSSTNTQAGAYDRGYWLGGSDIRTNQGRNYKRYQGQYDKNFERYFRDGYNDGFDNKPRRYPSPSIQPPIYPPVNPTYPTYPTYPTNPNPGYPGNSSGTATWSGRVDDRANIIIRGSTITAENVSGNGVQTQSQNMSGVLSRRDTVLSVRKGSGRGDVVVLQQPNRSNNFTGIIQITDPKGGSGDYRLDISWSSTGGNVEEPYSSGRVTWRGRVDQTVNIQITGNGVNSEDVTNTGLSNVDFSINGYLAGRPGSVNVQKKRGRGTVRVLEQPSWNNGFTAVIQIFDPNGGADNYELEITW